MLKTIVVAVENCSKIGGFIPGLVLRGISREQIKEMLAKYAVVVVRRRK